MKLIRKLTIPMLRNITLSESRMKKYYVLVPDKPVKLPIKYQDTSKFDFLPHKTTKGMVNMLFNLQTKERVVSNPLAQGTPKTIKVNFQLIWNNQISEHSRNKIALKLKESYQEALSKLPPITEGFPLKTSFKVCSKDELQDIDNLTILYIKTFHDAMVDAKVLPDDTLKYIKGYEAIHQDINTEGDYLEINIYSLDNPIRVTRRYLQMLNNYQQVA